MSLSKDERARPGPYTKKAAQGPLTRKASVDSQLSRRSSADSIVTGQHGS